MSSGYFYIGSSKDIKARLANHNNELERKTHRNRRLQNLFDKYHDEFVGFCLIQCNERIIEHIEEYLLRTLSCEKMLNLTTDTSAPMRGRKFSLEHRKKLSEARAGKKLSERQRLSLINKQLTPARIAANIENSRRMCEIWKKRKIVGLKIKPHKRSVESNKKRSETMIKIWRARKEANLIKSS